VRVLHRGNTLFEQWELSRNLRIRAVIPAKAGIHFRIHDGVEEQIGFPLSRE